MNSTVPAAVREIVTRNPVLYESLKMRVLNYNAVAKMISGEVEQIVGQPVRINTLVAALVRFAKDLDEEARRAPLSIFGGAKLSLVTGVSDMTIGCPAEQQYKLVERILDLAADGGHQVRVNQFPTYIKVATSSPELEEKIMAMKNDIKSLTEKRHAELHVKFSSEATLTPGVMALVTDLLFRNGISAVNAFFANEDVILTLDEDYASRAFESLRSEISRLVHPE